MSTTTINPLQLARDLQFHKLRNTLTEMRNAPEADLGLLLIRLDWVNATAWRDTRDEDETVTLHVNGTVRVVSVKEDVETELLRGGDLTTALTELNNYCNARDGR